MKKMLVLLAALLAYAGMAFAVVNINSASQKQLEELPGVGPAKAKAIIDYRKKNGPFKTTEDLKKVDGIGDATYDKIKGDLVTSGTTTGVGKAPEKKEASKKDQKK
jgi:competence protein ComEA